MKTILTTLQKEQLLEMCKHYLGEYERVEWSLSIKDSIFLQKRLENQKIDGSVLVGVFEDIRIHWFELCLLLSKKIEDTDITVMLQEHPVDYLYQKYNGR